MKSEFSTDNVLESAIKQLNLINSENPYHTIGVSDTFNSILSILAEKTSNLLGADGCVIEIIEGNLLVYKAVFGISSDFLGLELNKEGSLSGVAIDQNITMCCEDTEEDSRVNLEACRKIGLRSMVISPICGASCIGTKSCGPQRIGAIKSLFKTPRIFSVADILKNENMASLVGMAIINAIGVVEIKSWVEKQGEN